MWFMSRLSILILCSEKFRGCNCNFGLPTGSVDSFKNLPSIHHYIRRAKSILIKIENLVYIVRTFICYVHLFSWNAVHLGCFPTHGICATVKWELVQTGQGYHYLPGMHWMNLPPQLSKWRSTSAVSTLTAMLGNQTLTLLFLSLLHICEYLPLVVMAFIIIINILTTISVLQWIRLLML